MPAGDPGKEQFRRIITEFRNLHILAALGPLFDFRSEVVANDEFGVRGLRALHAPLLIDSYPLQERVLKSELVDEMLAELRPLGLVGIGILPGAIRHPIGLRHRLAAPDAFSGLTIGVQQSRVADAVMRALGARPVRLPAEVPNVEDLDGVEHLALGALGHHR